MFVLTSVTFCFLQLASGVSPREMCSAAVMNAIVGKALQLSVYSDTTEHAQHLAFALKNLPDIFKPNGKCTLEAVSVAEVTGCPSPQCEWSYICDSLRISNVYIPDDYPDTNSHQ